jgi:hypothetical protein
MAFRSLTPADGIEPWYATNTNIMIPTEGYNNRDPEREADHSPPTSIEVKKMWIITSTPPYVFMA